MFDFIKFLRKETNMARTENGAASYRTTNSACLDLFSRAGAMRNACETDITELFMRAYAEDPDTAMKIMFYIRDIRGGIGERRVFRAMADWLAHFDPGAIVRNMEYIPEFGRFDDLVELAVSGCPEPSAAAVEVIKQQLEKDVAGMERGEGISLLAKWLPSINASSSDTRKKQQSSVETSAWTMLHTGRPSAGSVHTSGSWKTISGKKTIPSNIRICLQRQCSGTGRLFSGTTASDIVLICTRWSLVRQR